MIIMSIPTSYQPRIGSLVEQYIIPVVDIEALQLDVPDSEQTATTCRMLINKLKLASVDILRCIILASPGTAGRYPSSTEQCIECTLLKLDRTSSK